MSGPIDLPVSLTYLHVRLGDGERWTYTPAAGHDVAWAAVSGGRLSIGDAAVEREMIVFDDGSKPIEFVARGATEFVLGSAARHPHPLVLGSHSVHTSEAALAEGQRTIAALARTPAVAELLRV